MRVLVTGKQGQLGQALAERAALNAVSELEFRFTDRSELDLARPETFESVLEALQPDVVINAAAYTAVDQAEDEPDLVMAVNAHGPGRLAELVGRRNGVLVQVSTDYVFDGSKAGPYGEEDPISPIGVYGRSKAEGERLIRAACARHVIVRTAWVFSPFGRNFPKTMLRLARERDEVRVVGDQHGNPTAAHDLADGLIAMCRSWLVKPNRGLGRTYNLAGSGSATWADVARVVYSVSAAACGPTAEVAEIASSDYPTKAKRPANSQLDSGLFLETFGYQAPPWQLSLKTVVERIVKNGNG